MNKFVKNNFMKKISEFFKWLVQKNQIALVYYSIMGYGFFLTFKEKESIIQNNSMSTFYIMLFAMITVCVVFTIFSVISEYKRRNDD
jgi:hypothetical protein